MSACETTTTENVLDPFEEFIPIDQLLPTEVVENTELQFLQQYDGFNPLEVKLLNHENYTPEELEQIRETLVEYEQRLLENFKGYDIRDEYPNEEEFEPFDFTETKLRLEELKTDEFVADSLPVGKRSSQWEESEDF